MAEISIDKLSAAYPARRLRASDADALLEVCAGNATYFRYMRCAPDKAHIIDDLTRRPPGTDARAGGDMIYVDEVAVRGFKAFAPERRQGRIAEQHRPDGL